MFHKGIVDYFLFSIVDSCSFNVLTIKLSLFCTGCLSKCDTLTIYEVVDYHQPFWKKTDTKNDKGYFRGLSAHY